MITTLLSAGGLFALGFLLLMLLIRLLGIPNRTKL